MSFGRTVQKLVTSKSMRIATTRNVAARNPGNMKLRLPSSTTETSSECKEHPLCVKLFHVYAVSVLKIGQQPRFTITTAIWLAQLFKDAVHLYSISMISKFTRVMILVKATCSE
jgi:hypothetical protein